MRNLLFVLLLIIIVGATNAENFTIKMLNTETINIDGQNMHVGDVFNEKAKINWSSDKQAMKVLSETNVLYVLTPKLFKLKGNRDFSDFIAATKAATVRATDGFPVSVEDHRNIMSDNFVLLDSLYIKIGWKIDKKSYFLAENIETGAITKIPLNDGYLIFKPDMFGKLKSNDGEMKLLITYVEEEFNDTTLVTNEMNIIVVPLMTK